MNYFLGISSLFLVGFAWPKCLSQSSGGRMNTYTYLLTEDARILIRFGKLPLERKGRCRNEFYPSGSYTRRYVSVGRRSGALVLRRRLSLLPRDSHGIRKLIIPIQVRFRCLRRRERYRYSSSFTRSRKIIRIHLIIFPINFADNFLLRYTPARISSKVPESKTFQGQHGSSSMLRILRLVSQKLERKAFDEMMSSVKVKKILEAVINEILAKHVPNHAGKQTYYSWYMNSLFSNRALDRLAKGCGCKQKKVIHCQNHHKYRTIDGTCNNIRNPSYGSAPRVLNRWLPGKYYDPEGLNDPIGYPGQNDVPDLPTTFKVVKDFIVQQDHPSRRNNRNSHALMQFGQFLDHDLDLSPETESSDNCQKVKCDGSKHNFAEPCYTILPLDKFRCIHFARSASACQIKHGRITKRQQLNVNTAYVDASQVYGSTPELAKNLRELGNDKGLMKIAPGVHGDLLPPDTRHLMAPNSFCIKSGGCFLAGDTRSSEQMVLACTHTLFVREHNRIARELGKLNPHWKGEIIYQETRKIIGAVLQKITYEDFLPIIIGRTAPRYHGYNPTIDSGILNSFSTAAFRFGHSLIRPKFDRLDKNYNPIGDPLELRHLFFNNTYIKHHGIDDVVLGLLANSSQIVDRKLAAGVLNHLFERPHSPGLNLAALNIQRGRDHGLPGYNAFRRKCGFKNAKTFRGTLREIPNRRNRVLLAKLYKNNPALADLWVAGLAEAPANGGIVGATFGCIIREQMKRAMDGDRFFYKKQGVFTVQQLKEIKKATLSKIICDNLKNIVSIQENAFLSGSRVSRRKECGNIAGIDLEKWKDRRHRH